MTTTITKNPHERNSNLYLPALNKTIDVVPSRDCTDVTDFVSNETAQHSTAQFAPTYSPPSSIDRMRANTFNYKITAPEIKTR